MEKQLIDNAFYVDVICRRFQEATGIVPVNEATGREHDFLNG